MHERNEKVHEGQVAYDEDGADEPTRTLTHEQFLRAKARALKNLDSFLARVRFQKKDS